MVRVLAFDVSLGSGYKTLDKLEHKHNIPPKFSGPNGFWPTFN